MPEKTSSEMESFIPIKNEENDIFSLYLYSDIDKLNAYIDLRVKDKIRFNIGDLINIILDTPLVINDKDKEKIINNITTQLSTNDAVEHFLILSGIPPTKGKDAYIELIDINKNTENKKDKDSSENEVIDFRERSKINIVQKEQAVGRYHPPEEGKEGRNIFGEIVPGKEGNSLSIAIGDNVYLDEQTNMYISRAEGKVVLNDEIFNVEETLYIEGNVDFNTGNIKFSGTVNVSNDVFDGFKVKAGKDIYIGGTINVGCIVESGGNIEIGGGITAKNQGLVKAGGVVRVKYINAGIVEAEDDVVVQTEIINSKVNSLGKVVVSKGTIIGSEVIALNGVEALVIGSRMGLPTILRVGVHFAIEKRFLEIKEKLTYLKKELKLLYEKVGPVISNKERLKFMTDHQKEIIKKTLLTYQQKKKEFESLQTEYLELSHRKSASAEDKAIKIARRIHAGVEMHIGHCRKIFTEDVYGYVKIVADETSGTLRVRHL